MISFFWARESQVAHGAKEAAVCSIPPSEVGVGIRDSEASEVERGSR